MTRASPRAIFSWCLYDWANSGFPTVIITFVFSAYFARAVAADTMSGTALWGHALAVSALLVAVAGPVFGAIADQTGKRKPWLGAFTALTVAATALLWFAAPDPGFVFWALGFFVLANIGYEMAAVFYNAMLPEIAPPSRVGRISGWSWGLGYMGGLFCLALTLLLFVQAERPVFGLDKEAAEHVRIVGPMVALWFAVFAVPLFLAVPDRATTGIRPGEAVRAGLRTLIETIRAVRAHANIARFLAARLLYVDGMNTMFAFGGIYAAGTFDMSIEEIIQFGIALNVTAGLGAAVFAWADDIMGPKRVVQIALIGLIALGAPLLLVESKTAFWLLALPLGIFMGPAQAASRSLMARMAPAEIRTEMFGLYAFSGRVTAFVGPALLAWATLAFESQRAGMTTVVVLLAGGLAILCTVKAPSRAQ